MMTKSPVPPVGLAWMTRISSRVPTRASFGNELQVAHPIRLGIEYQGTAWDSDVRVFTFLF